MKKYISLREAAKALGIPPSTVAYYKDRFEALLPEPVGQGRRRRYPEELVEVLGRIREMYSRNWPSERIEAVLAEAAPAARVRRADRNTAVVSPTAPSEQPPVPDERRTRGGPPSSPSVPADPDVHRVPPHQLLEHPESSVMRQERRSLDRELEDLRRKLAESATRLERCERDAAEREGLLSGRLEDVSRKCGELAKRIEASEQDFAVREALVNGQFDELRRELAERVAEVERGFAAREALLSGRLDELNQRRRELEERLKACEERDGSVKGANKEADAGPGPEAAASGPDDAGPPERLLDLPLVIRGDNGEFLGVSGRDKPFSLNDFLGILRTGAAKNRITEKSWSRRGDLWRLLLHSRGSSGKKLQEHVIEAECLVTPRGNEVMLLSGLIVDGRPAPQPLLMLLFRKIRDGFAS